VDDQDKEVNDIFLHIWMSLHSPPGQDATTNKRIAYKVKESSPIGSEQSEKLFLNFDLTLRSALSTFFIKDFGSIGEVNFLQKNMDKLMDTDEFNSYRSIDLKLEYSKWKRINSSGGNKYTKILRDFKSSYLKSWLQIFRIRPGNIIFDSLNCIGLFRTQSSRLMQANGCEIFGMTS